MDPGNRPTTRGQDAHADANAPQQPSNMSIEGYEAGDTRYPHAVPVEPNPSSPQEFRNNPEHATIEVHSTPAGSQEDSITFVDNVSVSYILPWQRCKTYEGMREMVEEVYSRENSRRYGRSTSERSSQDENTTKEAYPFGGKYDLVGPGGQVILPSAWEIIVRPGWVVGIQQWDSRSGE
ncbi:hypothetical protein BDY21DRAFT_30119 [Lineolata rhizophorae]|uniref:Ubiquitin-like domain-containing protein n=1 Tax=Lineolata rhizophorae TaxID=578093 RepID=A0A6A6P157_9PEZI|nr:hypothetical protein BDY21DRAFT_30119 [Lineolata rhizophorae]